MPTTYQSKDKKFHLRYFNSSCEVLIMEKDSGHEDDEPEDFQAQAYGKSNLGYGWELGYISVPELIRNNYEIDLYYKYVPET